MLIVSTWYQWYIRTLLFTDFARMHESPMELSLSRTNGPITRFGPLNHMFWSVDVVPCGFVSTVNSLRLLPRLLLSAMHLGHMPLLLLVHLLLLLSFAICSRFRISSHCLCCKRPRLYFSAALFCSQSRSRIDSSKTSSSCCLEISGSMISYSILVTLPSAHRYPIHFSPSYSCLSREPEHASSVGVADINRWFRWLSKAAIAARIACSAQRVVTIILHHLH